jgi:hypothetical protein
MMFLPIAGLPGCGMAWEIWVKGTIADWIFLERSTSCLLAFAGLDRCKILYLHSNGSAPFAVGIIILLLHIGQQSLIRRACSCPSFFNVWGFLDRPLQQKLGQNKL